MLSGGKDSVALLEILHHIERLPTPWSGLQLNLTLHHFNHRRRGVESDEDEALCTDLARKLGYPIVIHRWSATLEDKLSGGFNFQAVARDWRYQSVCKFAERSVHKGHQSRWVVVTAHHRRDHAETLLHNIVRGCGTDGLRSMLPWNAEKQLLRPLLWLQSDQLDDYITKKSLPHREDSSNQQLDYTRNRLRNVVITELEKINPQAIEHIWNLSQDLPTVTPAPLTDTSKTNPIPAQISTSASASVSLDKLEGIAEVRSFLLSAAPELASQLTRDKLTNILAHVRKLTANPSHSHGYKIALSERCFVTINSKQLEIKVTP
jgi:tRNA(Ile)-lysidine synthetase-like protein